MTLGQGLGAGAERCEFAHGNPEASESCDLARGGPGALCTAGNAKLVPVSTPVSAALSAQVDYIAATTQVDPAIVAASHTAEAEGISFPGSIAGRLTTALAAAGASTDSAGAVVVSPAASVVGLYALAGLSERQSLTCIEPSAERLAVARTTFREAGVAPARTRFLTARPLDVMGRLAAGGYHLAYLDVSPLDMAALIDAALPVLAPGGSVILANSLLDGTIGDHSRRDRDTQAARAADEYILGLEGVTIARLPVDGGLTIVTRIN